jgi:hypothetical protein
MRRDGVTGIVRATVLKEGYITTPMLWVTNIIVDDSSSPELGSDRQMSGIKCNDALLASI